MKPKLLQRCEEGLQPSHMEEMGGAHYYSLIGGKVNGELGDEEEEGK